MSDYKPNPLPNLSQKDLDRFWAKVTTGKINECWPWSACIAGGGYGSFWIGPICYPAHRIAYFIAFNHDPAPLLIRHKCDNKWCVNPHHLIPGTHKENSQDAIARNRNKGNFAPTLNEGQVIEIRAKRARGESLESLAHTYGVTIGAIIPIVKGKSWKRSLGPIESQKPHLTLEKRQEIRAKRAAGAILTALAAEYGMSLGAIGMLCDGTTWKNDPPPAEAITS